MAEVPRQDSRSRGDSHRLGRAAVADRQAAVRRAAVAGHAGGHDLGAEPAPRWSFGSESSDLRPAATNALGDRGPGVGEPRRSSFGPAGKRRRPAGVALLAVLTLGLYSSVWHHKVNCEMGDFDPRLQVRPARSTLAVTIPWLLGLAATLAGVALLVARSTRPARVAFLPDWLAYALLAGLLAVPYLTLLLPFGGIAVTMTLERLRLLQEHTGVSGDVQVQPAREVTRLLIPLTGGLLLMMREQRGLDHVWEWADTAPNRRPRRS